MTSLFQPLRRHLADGLRSGTAPLRRRLVPQVPRLEGSAVLEAGYYSQYGQDILLDRLFDSGRTGTFVDIGAHDGVAFSNTCFLERSRGWTGLCIEPNPAVFERLVQNRECRTRQVAVGPEAGRTAFRVVEGYGEMLSGIESAYDDRHRRRLQRDIERNGGRYRMIEVEVARLDRVLEDSGLDSVDLLSIDVEGGEVGVVNSIDLQAFQVQVVVIENNHGGTTIMRVLERQGFRLLLRLGQDELYVSSPWDVLRDSAAKT